jgi:hypothetical protein
METHKVLGDFSMSKVPDNFFANLQSYNDASCISSNFAANRMTEFSQQQQQMNLDFYEVVTFETQIKPSTVDQNFLYDFGFSDEPQKLSYDQKVGTLHT